MNIKIYDLDYTTNQLFSTIPDTELIEIIENSIKLLHFQPDILQKIDEDQTEYALEKKKLRIEDRLYYQNKDVQDLGFEITEKERDIEDLQLLPGKKRMSPQTLYLFMMIRGYFGSVTNRQSIQSMRDSLTLYIILQNWDVKMPGVTTILENLNCITNETREYILDMQIKYIIEEGLDDFKIITIDSTHVEANTEWPTDSGMIFALLNRAYHYSQKLYLFEVENFKPHWVPTWLKQIKRLIYKINMTLGKKKLKGKIKKYYRKILEIAQKIHDHLINEIQRKELQIKTADIRPSKRVQLNRIWELIKSDVLDTVRVLYYTEERVFNGIILKSTEKILSISDKSAAFIEKGNRNPVIGYKPQVARSSHGFIPNIFVPEGNTKDSRELEPLVDNIIERTGVIPETISVDDGYASKDNMEKLLKKKIAVVSISGSKGKKITTYDRWNSEEYEDARRNRSAVESTIFCLKNNFNFRSVRRRGIDNVRGEVIEKIIVYNFARIPYAEEIIRQEKLEAS